MNSPNLKSKKLILRIISKYCYKIWLDIAQQFSHPPTPPPSPRTKRYKLWQKTPGKLKIKKKERNTNGEIRRQYLHVNFICHGCSQLDGPSTYSVAIWAFKKQKKDNNISTGTNKAIEEERQRRHFVST